MDSQKKAFEQPAVVTYSRDELVLEVAYTAAAPSGIQP
jgi:hypothetical protein